jgi:hypothetical protein
MSRLNNEVENGYIIDEGIGKGSRRKGVLPL